MVRARAAGSHRGLLEKRLGIPACKAVQRAGRCPENARALRFSVLGKTSLRMYARESQNAAGICLSGRRTYHSRSHSAAPIAVMALIATVSRSVLLSAFTTQNSLYPTRFFRVHASIMNSTSTEGSDLKPIYSASSAAWT